MTLNKRLQRRRKEGAIYLDQPFYELVFRYCRQANSGFSVLRDIALLRFKSPTLVIVGDQLKRLIEDLDQRERLNHRHPHIEGFKTACKTAINKNCALTVSGDMYPELDDTSE